MKLFSLFSACLLALGAAWVALSMPPAGSVTQGKVPAPRQGFLAPDFELQDIQGQAVRLSDLRGKPVLLNFWASWCPPCQAEMPDMQKVYDSYAARGFVVLAVNTTYQDSQSEAARFAQAHALTFPILLDQTGDASHRYEIRSMPTSFFIDRQGIIQTVVVGGPMSEGLLRSEAERLLKGGP